MNDNNVRSQLFELGLRYAKLINSLVPNANDVVTNVNLKYHHSDTGEPVLIDFTSNILDITVALYRCGNYDIILPNNEYKTIYELFGGRCKKTDKQIRLFIEEVKIVNKIISTYIVIR